MREQRQVASDAGLSKQRVVVEAIRLADREGVDGLSMRRLAGALGAITAAVVGVIANLALWFAAHVLFTDLGPFGVPQWSTLRPAPAVLTAVALLLMFALKWNLGRTLAVCALLGAATSTLG